jgi:hypothetical protein
LEGQGGEGEAAHLKYSLAGLRVSLQRMVEDTVTLEPGWSFSSSIGTWGGRRTRGRERGRKEKGKGTLYNNVSFW